MWSSADWLQVPESWTEACEKFRPLRDTLLDMAGSWGLPARFDKGFPKGSAGPFSVREEQELREIGVAFARSHGIVTDTGVEQGQPFVLGLLNALLNIAGDPDAQLPMILKEGVGTGVWEAIPSSGAYLEEDRAKKLCKKTDAPSPVCCAQNWGSAVRNPQKVRGLLMDEVSKGFVEKWPGTLEEARARWGADKVAVGKLALIEEDGKEDRLVGDSSAAGMSQCAVFPERMRHPRPCDVEEALLRCKDSGGLVVFSY